jgi:hypothetical protein
MCFWNAKSVAGIDSPLNRCNTLRVYKLASI